MPREVIDVRRVAAKDRAREVELEAAGDRGDVHRRAVVLKEVDRILRVGAGVAVPVLNHIAFWLPRNTQPFAPIQPPSQTSAAVSQPINSQS